MDKIEVWRDVAMHRLHRPPNPSLGDEANAERHYDAVLKFYLDHQWLGEAVPSSFAEEVALAKLLGYCEVLREHSLGATGNCLVPASI